MRRSENETPQERAERLKKQNDQYRKRALLGWRHPKDRRGPNLRLIRRFKKGPFSTTDLISALKRDAGFPAVKSEGVEISFREWLRGQRDVEGS